MVVWIAKVSAGNPLDRLEQRKVVADIAIHNGYREIVFLDDDTSLRECMGYEVVGPITDAAHFKDADFFVAVGNPQVRESIMNKLITSGYHIVTLVHPQAVIAHRVEIGTGTVVMAGTVINSDSKIGSGCIINTGATIDHDNVLEDYVHVAVGSHLAGNVYIGRGTWIGAGAVVSNRISICGACIVGAGAVVVSEIKEKGTYVGVPARKIGILERQENR